MKYFLGLVYTFWILSVVVYGGTVPAGFKTETIAEGVNAGTALTIVPDGTVYFAEQTGHIRIVRDGLLLERPLLDISARVDTFWERGLVGMEFDPHYPEKPYLYVLYVMKLPYVHHVVSRFTVENDVADLGSERIIFEGDDQAMLGGSQPSAHQGGPMRFGPDGKLYIGLGEQTEDLAAQSMETLQGKILRLNPDGSIPEDNPFYETAKGKYRSIYALGIRNPFGLAFQPGTGRLFEADIGKSSFDEINEIKAGRNYGWPLAEGMSNDETFTNPVHAYPPAIGRCICGSMFYPSSGKFPDPWKGKFFFVDWASNWIKAIDVDNPKEALDFGSDFDSPVAIEASPDGSIWVLNRNTRWRDQKKFANNSGSLTRISYVGGDYNENESIAYPLMLSEMGVLETGEPFQPVDGFERFEMNLPIWRPGMRVDNWVKMPEDGKIESMLNGEWVFPLDTTIIQHFQNYLGEAHETHLYRANGDGTFHASAYRWNVDSVDAALVSNTTYLPIDSDPSNMWLSPRPVVKLDPKTAIFGFQPQFNLRQLNVGSQLAEWNDRSWFENALSKRALNDLPKLHALDDESIPVVDRVRSYLDVNCASCHKPGGASRGYFDARLLTAFENQNLLRGELMAGDLGVSGAKLITPGEPEKSVLYLRLARKDGFRMPPGSTSSEDPPILLLMDKWIREMDSSDSGGN